MARSNPNRKHHRTSIADMEPSQLEYQERIRVARLEHVIGAPATRQLVGWLEQDGANMAALSELLGLIRYRTNGPTRSRNIPRSIRAAVWEKTGGFCYWCNRAMNPFSDFTCDHVVPLSKGGETSIENLVPCCHGCNGRKGSEESLSW